MIKVLVPTDFEFKIYEPQLKKMYEESQEKICDTNSFEFIINNTLYYAFIKDGIILGAIYFFDDGDKLFLNAYASKKHHRDNIECLKMSTKWFKCDIYAEAQNRASALCLLRAGFRREYKNLFVYKH